MAQPHAADLDNWDFFISSRQLLLESINYVQRTSCTATSGRTHQNISAPLQRFPFRLRFAANFLEIHAKHNTQKAIGLASTPLTLNFMLVRYQGLFHPEGCHLGIDFVLYHYDRSQHTASDTGYSLQAEETIRSGLAHFDI